MRDCGYWTRRALPNLGRRSQKNSGNSRCSALALLHWPPWLLWVMTWPALAMSAFLGYSLIANGHQCRICWTGHVSNAVLQVPLGQLLRPVAPRFAGGRHRRFQHGIANVPARDRMALGQLTEVHVGCERRAGVQLHLPDLLALFP